MSWLLQELWSLLEFMLPEIFDSGDIDLKDIFGNRTTSDNQMGNVDLITRIKAILGPFVLRRLKSDVMQQLVAKTQKVVYVIFQAYILIQTVKEDLLNHAFAD